MASLSFTQLLPLPRWRSNLQYYKSMNLMQLQDLKLHNKWGLRATHKKKIGETLSQETPEEKEVVLEKKTSKTPKRIGARMRKKVITDAPEEDSEAGVSNDENIITTLDESVKKAPRKTRKKAVVSSSDAVDEKTEKKVTRKKRTKKVDDMVVVMQHVSESEAIDIESNISDKKRTKKVDDVVVVMQHVSESEASDIDASTDNEHVDEEESEDDIDLEKYEGEDISITYGWPPLVCCFGSALHAFIPSGRPANRLIDYEVHERMKDALWAPKKFVRAPGGSAGGVAIALASLGGKVAFMGKLGDDDYGQAMLSYLNTSEVQTRAVRVDGKRPTAISYMKVSKRGRLKMTCLKPCAESSLSKSEINVDVLKQAKIFYFSTHSLLDKNMRSSTLQALKISKKLGSVIFYDVNLPLPLWKSGAETKEFIQQVWNLADIIEVTKQELEFLCGIEPTEEFDTKNNSSSKFVHYEPEIVKQLWHENLKVLFVTNGTSKIHYYTDEHDGAVHGMEAPPMTPFASDMSASGDGIVAGLMRMLSVQPDLITDKGYLERSIKYAIDCGVIDQWIVAQTRGFPPNEDMEEEEVERDPNGIMSITEKEFRTLKPVS